MDFLTLQRKLQEHNLEIFTLNDIVKITQQQKDVVKSKLTILVKQKKILRLKKGFYALKETQDKFQLQRVFKKTYIALHSALEYYQSTTQRFNSLDLITANVLNKQNIEDTTIEFHKVKKELFFGFERVSVKNTEVFISNIEKTIIDCIYFSSKVYLSEIKDFIKKYKGQINTELLKTYLEKINSSTLNKRVGYLLESEGIHLHGLAISNKYEKLNVNKRFDGKKDAKWKLMVNEEL